jgi:hypothetical protein
MLSPLTCPTSSTQTEDGTSCLPLLSILPALSLTLTYFFVSIRPWRFTPRIISESAPVRRVRRWGRWFRPFLTLEEAEALLAEGGDENEKLHNGRFRDGTDAANGADSFDTESEETPLLNKSKRTHRRKTDANVKISSFFFLTYTLVPLTLSLSWLSIAAYHLSISSSSPSNIPTITVTVPILLTLTYLTALLLFLTTPFRPTPPYILLILYGALLGGVVVVLGSEVYAWAVKQDGEASLDRLGLIAWTGNLVALALLIGVGVMRPMAIPPSSVDLSKIVRPLSSILQLPEPRLTLFLPSSPGLHHLTRTLHTPPTLAHLRVGDAIGPARYRDEAE